MLMSKTIWSHKKVILLYIKQGSYREKYVLIFMIFIVSEEQALHQIYIDEMYGAVNKGVEEDKKK